MVGEDVDEFIWRGCVGDVNGDGHVCQGEGGALAGVGDGGGVFQYGWGVDDGCRLRRAQGWRRNGRRRSVLRLYRQQAGKQARGDVGVQARFCAGCALPLAARDNGSRRLPRARAPEGTAAHHYQAMRQSDGVHMVTRAASLWRNNKREPPILFSFP